MINDINFLIQWYVNMSHYLWPHGPLWLPYQSYRHFRASRETMASDPEGQLSDQSDIPANSEVVINWLVSKDNLWRWCGLKIITCPSRCACRNIECTSKYSCALSLRSMAARGGGLLPYKRLMGMSHFHKWIDYFKRVTRMGSRIFWFLGVRPTRSSYLRLANVPECLYCRWKVIKSVLHSI